MGEDAQRRRRAGLVLLVAAIPALLLFFGVANFILNHFFVRAPYLLDSGLLSGIAYRSGALQAVPEVAMTATSFYQVYFSPIVSVFSGLSYLFPVHRIEWFAFVQGLVFFPLGMAVPLLGTRLGRDTLLRRLPTLFIAAATFSFGGLVLWMVGYPHYEAATPGLICLMLVSVVTGRNRSAWLFLGLAASVRQDSGVHAALALAPLWYLSWRGVQMIPSRRRLLTMIGVAVGTTVFGIVVQKLFFDTFDRLRDVYLGTPTYGHLDGALIVARAKRFFEICQVIYYPFLATALLSILRRDARYLLGWAAAGPWFVFNFIAFDDQKSMFTAYSVMPFLVSVFWIYLYGAFLARPERRFLPWVLEIVFALVCVASTLGMHRGAAAALKFTVAEMAIPRARDRAAVHGFVEALDTHRSDFGELSVDYAVSAIALEHLHLRDTWTRSRNVGPDSFVFHDRAQGEEPDVLFPEIVASSMDWCTRIVGTHIVVCSRKRFPPTTFEGLATQVVPAAFVFSRLFRSSVRVDADGVTLGAGASVYGPFGRLPAGTYECVVSFTTTSSSGVRMFVETDLEPISDVSVTAGANDLRLTFVIGGEEHPIAYRFTAGQAPLTIREVRVRRIDGPGKP